VGAVLVPVVIHAISLGEAQGLAQDMALVTKAPKLKKEHGLIDWKRNAEQIRNHIRAMQPWPTAFSFLHQRNKAPTRVIMARAEYAPGLPNLPASTAPGSIIPVDSGAHFCVATGEDDVLEIVELQPAGKRRMSGTEFLRGHPIHEGDYFGPEQS
jgi:methionyl-tRNA formyltransferase